MNRREIFLADFSCITVIPEHKLFFDATYSQNRQDTFLESNARGHALHPTAHAPAWRGSLASSSHGTTGFSKGCIGASTVASLKHVSDILEPGAHNPYVGSSSLSTATNPLKRKSILRSANGKLSVKHPVKARPASGTGAAKGKAAEIEVAGILRSLGFGAKIQPHPSPFDIDCEGTRIEVKYSSLCHADRKSVNNHWNFNIHRHGIVDESRVDVYVLVCGGNRIASCKYFLIVPAPLGCCTYQVSLRSIRGKRHAKYLNRWELIAQHRKAA